MSAQRLTQGTPDFTNWYSSRRVAKTKSHGSQSNKNEESFWLGQQLRYKLSYLTEEKNWYNFIFVPWRRFWHSSDLEVVVHLTEPTHPLRTVNHFKCFTSFCFGHFFLFFLQAAIVHSRSSSSWTWCRPSSGDDGDDVDVCRPDPLLRIDSWNETHPMSLCGNSCPIFSSCLKNRFEVETAVFPYYLWSLPWSSKKIKAWG